MKMRAKKTWTGSFRVDIDNKTNKKKHEEISQKKMAVLFLFYFKIFNGSGDIEEKRIFQTLKGLDTNSFNYKKKNKACSYILCLLNCADKNLTEHCFFLHISPPHSQGLQ